MIFLCYRVSALYEKGRASMGLIAMTKAHVSRLAREVAAECRELMGGNGMLIENFTIVPMLDLEGIYTYGGNYEVNTLVAGNEITGFSASM